MQRKRGHFLTKKIIKKQPLFWRKKNGKNRRNFCHFSAWFFNRF
jgi:hypothetical protein